MEPSETSIPGYRQARQAATDFGAVNPVALMRLVSSAGSAFAAQAALHAQLASVEWQQEKNRLLKMLALMLVGLSSLICLMLVVGALLLVLSWETALRIPAMALVVAIYAAALAIAWHKFNLLASLGGQAFAATREELVADIAMIRSRL